MSSGQVCEPLGLVEPHDSVKAHVAQVRVAVAPGELCRIDQMRRDPALREQPAHVADDLLILHETGGCEQRDVAACASR